MKKRSILALAITSALLSSSAIAEIRINGFASVVAGLDTEDKDFSDSPYTEDFDFKPESKFAIQLSADLAEGLSATAQIMARGVNDFDAEFEWAYLSYEINDQHTLRAGKLRLPFYKYSDYLDVGYAYPWIRPPRAMYSLQFSSFEGLSLLSNFSLGSWDLSSNVFWGNVNDTFFSTTTPTVGQLEDIAGINIQISKNWFSAYVAYVGTDVVIPHSGIEGAADLVDLVAQGQNQGTNIRMDGDYGDFLGFGFTIDTEHWLFNTEWSTVGIEDSMTLDTKQWYMSLGYRINEFMPYITYQTTESERRTEIANALPSTPVPATVHPGQPPLNIFIQSAFDAQQFEYNAYTLGIRYNFHPSAAFKLEYNRYEDIIDIGRLGTNADPEDSGNLSIGVDLVF